MTENARPKSSPSFLIAVALVVAAAGGYAAYYFLAGGPVVRSERIARRFAADAGKEVRVFRRAVRDAVAGAKDDPGGVEAALAKIEASKREALAKIEALARTAHERIDSMEELPIKTQRNRAARIRNRLRETEKVMDEIIEEARSELRGEPLPRAER